MPTVFLRQFTIDYLRKQSDGKSIDDIICELLNLGKGADGTGLVIRHTPKEKLADRFAYTWTILNQLRAYDQSNPQMGRSELQKKVIETLEIGDLFTMFPDDALTDKRNQPKWKQRFTNALSHLIKMGCIEARERTPGSANQTRGVQYRATDLGLGVIADIVLHLCPRRELPATKKGEYRYGHCYLYRDSSHIAGRDTDGNEICPKPLETSEIPSELAGRVGRPSSIKDWMSLAEKQGQEPIDWASATPIAPQS